MAKGKKLLIVESPSKTKTIKKMLGDNFIIDASFGHVIDLPKTTLGIDIKNGYKPRYKVLKDKVEVIEKLKKYAKNVDEIYLASDPDREGEAIAWHIANALNEPDKIKRVVFNEITKKAVTEALKNPRSIDMNLVDAQQTRRLLDRIVGYEISPLLWKRVSNKASAGRVQSVSLKIICDREDEIKNFISEKYYNVSLVIKDGVELSLNKINGKKFDKLTDEKILEKIKDSFKNKKIVISDVDIKSKKQEPPFAFKTSTLQQLASSYLGFSPTKTMTVAQKLYEGISINGNMQGLITYMRTDSTRIATEASYAAQKFIEAKYGKEYTYKNRYQKGQNSQDAHEGIRPTNVELEPDNISGFMTRDQYKLYKLIWDRFVISQMAPVEYDQMKITVKKDGFEFNGNVNKITFKGYYLLYKSEDNIQTSDLPTIKANDEIDLKNLKIEENMTKPPARYTEAALVKKLESEEIGRPSTYASILNSLKEKKYVDLEDKKLVPTELGYTVKNELEKYFSLIMDIKFTANLEKYLDKIADGNLTMFETIDEFYKALSVEINEYSKNIEKLQNEKIYTDIYCSNKTDKMIYKLGIFGPYLVCETNKDEKISLKGVAISEEEIKNGFINLKDKMPVIEKNEYQTDYIEDNISYVLKKGRYGWYLESSNYKQDKIRKTIDKTIQVMINKKMIDIVDGVAKISSVLLNAQNRIANILKDAGKCEKCGSDFVVKMGRYGEFLACSNYPTCKNIKKIPKKGK